MAFILEDGTGVTGANALISVAEFNELSESRGVPSYTYLDADKQSAIVIASVDYINTFFKFKGASLTDTQGMQLPTDQVGIVNNIKLACYQAAALHLKGRLFVDSSEIELNGQVILERDKLDVLESEKEYKEGGNYTYKYPTVSIDRLLQQYTLASGGMGSALRW